MKEQLVSFETAKLAKEKGFKGLTLNFYFEDGEFRENKLTGTNGYYGDEYTIEYEELLENWNSGFMTKKNGDRCFGCSKSSGYLETYSAPTQSLLQKWLREVHNLIVIIDWGPLSEKYSYEIYHNGKDYDGEYVNDTYEKALEAGLYCALNLIKTKDIKV